jgi:hypothetical protein
MRSKTPVPHVQLSIYTMAWPGLARNRYVYIQGEWYNRDSFITEFRERNNFDSTNGVHVNVLFCNRIVQYIRIIASIIRISGSSEHAQVHESSTNVSGEGLQADTERPV